MPRSWKRPKTGVYDLHRRVPAELVEAVGKSGEKASPGTRGPAEAKARHLVEIYKLDERGANLSKVQQALSAKQV